MRPPPTRRRLGSVRDEPRSARASRGFTLVEVLIALSLLALIATSLFGALRYASRASAAGDAAVTRAADVLATQEWLRRVLTQAAPVLTRNEAGTATALLRGDADSLRFAAPLPAHLGGGGLYRIGLTLEDAGDARRLVVTYAPYHAEAEGAALDEAVTPGAEAPARPRMRVLVEGLHAASFAYFGVRAENEAPGWGPEWRDAPGNPALIELRAERAGDGGTWPTLAAAPMADAAYTIE